MYVNLTEVIKILIPLFIARRSASHFNYYFIISKPFIIKLYNYVPLFEELYKYFPLIKKTDINYSLYSNDNPDTSEKVSFKNEKEAIKSIEKIKKKSHTYQVKVILTLYNRAKYHPHQTPDMRKAMLIFSKWLKKNEK